MKTMDILIVDDDNTHLHLLSMFLKGEGFEVAVASDGINALQLMRHINFRMMITDFCMPNMNGLELATKVKELHPGTPVGLMTGNAISDLIESAFVAGISKVFSKPLDLQGLLSFIRSLLRARQNCVLNEQPLARGFQKLVGC